MLAELILALAALQDPPASPVRPYLTSDARHLNPDAPMRVRMMIDNPSDADVEVVEPGNWLDAVEIRDELDNVLRKPVSGTAGPKRRIEARGFFGRSVDLKPLFQDLKFQEGILRISWSHAGQAAKPLYVAVMRDWIATIETNFGDLKVEFFPDKAPRHVLNFLTLAREKFYDGLPFHRIIPGFVVQGGGGKEEPAFRLKAEFNDRKHEFGTLSMARGAEEDSASTQFFFSLREIPKLDGRYTVFGRLVDGEKVLREMEKVKTDHSPCPKCGKEQPAAMTACCGAHHEDRPKVDVTIKKITLTPRIQGEPR